MNLVLKLALLLTFTQFAQCLPFPFELGGDREDDDDDWYPAVQQRQWGYMQPSPRSSTMMMMPPPPSYQSRQPMRRMPFTRRLFGGRFGGNGRSAQNNEDEDEKNREKVQQAMQAQQTIIDTVLPMVNSIAPATAGFFGMLPRMRRSHGSTANDAPDQLSMPSEQAVSILMPIKEMNQSPESVAPSVVVPINYQQATMLMDQSPVGIQVMSGKGESEMEDKNDDEDESDDDGEENNGSKAMMSLPQVISPSLLPHPPDATVTSGDDDKIYFAVDRKTIMSFLGALFGNDLRAAFAAAVHENSVHKP